jgi:hypothetical protein
LIRTRRVNQTRKDCNHHSNTAKRLTLPWPHRVGILRIDVRSHFGFTLPLRSSFAVCMYVTEMNDKTV